MLTRARRRAGLDHRERGEFPVGNLELRPQRVQAGRLEPLRAPAGKVTARRLFEGAHQIVEGGVAVGVFGEIVPQTRQERLAAHVGDQLLEHGSALGVGDSVEVHLHRRQVRDVGGDRVRGGQLILPVGPRLLHVRECRPGAGVFGRRGLAQHRGEGGERLVQPQVVPPLHGDQIAEPHVRHLVQHGLATALVRGASHLGAEHVILEEGDRARVLHCAGVEFGHEQLVVLAERVRHTEIGVVEAEALLGLGEQPLGVHVLRQRGAAVDAQRDAAVRVGVGVGPLGVRARDQGDEVGAHARGGGEGVPHHRAGRLRVERGAVGDDLPILRRGDGDVVGGLEVRLVEAGEHPLGVGGLELRIQVDLVVGGVDEPVQALAGMRVFAIGLDDQLVALGQAGQGEPLGLVVVADLEGSAVQHRRTHPGRDDVDERLRAGRRGEDDRRAGHERLARAVLGVGRLARQVELDAIVLHADRRGPCDGLLTGEVRCGQGDSFAGRRTCRAGRPHVSGAPAPARCVVRSALATAS